MKELVEEKAKLDDKAICLGDKCSMLTTPLFTYMTGTVTLYGAVNITMVATDPIGIWRTTTLAPFIYLLNYYKETALAQLKSMEDVEMMRIKEKHIKLKCKMNRLRFSIDAAASPKYDVAEEEIEDVPELKLAKMMDDESAGDNFYHDCEKILAIIREPNFQAIKKKINATFWSGLLVLAMLGITFLVHSFYYYFRTSGSVPPPLRDL